MEEKKRKHPCLLETETETTIERGMSADREGFDGFQEGEEITHCYRPDWRMGTSNRRAALLEEYDFFCECVVCTDPTEDD